MVEQSVNDIADSELIRRVLYYLWKKRGAKRRPLWDAVGTHFCLGSTYSMQLCRRFGLNPDERVA